ncbi:hypothetical protein ABH940_003252 [Streptacidiphilus sp. BW17]|uniref:hypothetical protein n=1 Tax=unclassified Streptacidiphilus TaxID=2643834 RepID=UPI003516A4EE
MTSEHLTQIGSPFANDAGDALPSPQSDTVQAGNVGAVQRSLDVRIGSHFSMSVSVSPMFLTLLTLVVGGAGGNLVYWASQLLHR